VFPGSKVSKNSVDALSVENIDISKHQPKQLDFQLISDADLVLTMSSSHKSAIINEFPDLKDKVYTIAEFVGEKSDVSDPFGGDLNLYKSCMIDIKSLIEKLILRIKANE
ncbi:low molecular weight protein arginine phosphatase, partial [Monoglobus pectinilyticus]